MKAKKIVRLKKEDLKAAGILKSPHTLYKWHSQGKFPRLFTKIGGNLYVVIAEWNRLITQNQGKRKKRKKF